MSLEAALVLIASFAVADLGAPQLLPFEEEAVAVGTFETNGTGAAARRWGMLRHRLAARAEAAHLPEKMPAFFRGSRAQLEYLNLEPEREVGLLPFHVTELFQRLENGFRRWRGETNPEVRRWLEERIIFDAGVLGHYVTDASQPHHTTVHFNGWNEALEENPGGFTTDRGFHARFESRFVNAHVREDHVMQGFPAEPAPVDDGPLEATWAFVRESNTHLPRLYALDRDHGLQPDEPPHSESLAFAVERIQAGGAFLRDLWWAAWLASGGEG